jgi:hypothetical protein
MWWSIKIFWNVTLHFWLLLIRVVLEVLWSFETQADTNPEAQYYILEVLNLHVAIVEIPRSRVLNHRMCLVTVLYRCQ